MGAGGKKKVEVEGQRLAAHRCPSPHRPIAALAATIRHENTQNRNWLKIYPANLTRLAHWQACYFRQYYWTLLYL